jgi:hypothetical protein
MDKYNREGVEYRICPDCADKLPDPVMDQFDNTFGPFSKEE